MLTEEKEICNRQAEAPKYLAAKSWQKSLWVWHLMGDYRVCSRTRNSDQEGTKKRVRHQGKSIFSSAFLHIWRSRSHFSLLLLLLLFPLLFNQIEWLKMFSSEGKEQQHKSSHLRFLLHLMGERSFWALAHPKKLHLSCRPAGFSDRRLSDSFSQKRSKLRLEAKKSSLSQQRLQDQSSAIFVFFSPELPGHLPTRPGVETPNFSVATLTAAGSDADGKKTWFS